MKKVISIILIITICMATFTTVAFADADIDVQVDGFDAQAEETVENNLDAEPAEENPSTEEKKATATDLIEEHIEEIKEFVEPSEELILTAVEDVEQGVPEDVTNSRIEFFAVFDNEREAFKKKIDDLYGNRTDLTFNYLFLEDDIAVVNNSEKLVSYIHNSPLNLANREVLIAVYDMYVFDYEYDTEIDIIYSGSDEDSLYLKTEDGSLVKLSKVSNYGDDGKKIARIKLNNEVWSSISYFSNSYCGVDVFKLVGETENTDIVIHSISVRSAAGSYSIVRCMDEDCHYEDPAAGLTITSDDGKYIGALFDIQDDTLLVYATSNSLIETVDGYENVKMIISAELDKQFFDVYIPEEDPQTEIEKILEEGNDDDLATDTDLHVATDTDIDEEPESAPIIEETPEALPAEIDITEDVQEVPEVVEEVVEQEEITEPEESEVEEGESEETEAPEEIAQEETEAPEEIEQEETESEETEEDSEEDEKEEAEVAEEQSAESEEQGQETEPEPSEPEQIETEPEVNSAESEQSEPAPAEPTPQQPESSAEETGIYIETTEVTESLPELVTATE